MLKGNSVACLRQIIKQVNKTEVNKYSHVLFTVHIQKKRRKKQEEKYPEGTARKKNKRLRKDKRKESMKERRRNKRKSIETK